ncbi:MAG TPA: tetratricopeptide repeat protein, partial [Polyangiaceae bacterium LLY-WYZ-15_(1-7)]|nr:tetratricopeptide repeat protein [Polyangiaceae bacterium LLY-WYZ-15_(1-7)]
GAADAAERRVDEDEARYRRSRALRRAGRHAEAVEVLDAIAAREPPSRRTARALFDAALLRMEELGDRPAALEGFERVLSEHADSGLAGRALHHRLGAFGEGEEATKEAFLRRLDRELAATRLHDDVLWALHDLHAEAEDRAGARRALERIVAEHPYPQGHRWDDAILRLAEMDVEDGRPRDAIARLEAMLERSEDTTVVGSYTLPAFIEAQLTIARLHRDAGDRDAAARAYRAVYDDFPRSTLRDDALTELGEMQLGAGEREAGCETLLEVALEFEVGRARRRAAERLGVDCPEEAAELAEEEAERAREAAEAEASEGRDDG